jgi:hypothetical protein
LSIGNDTSVSFNTQSPENLITPTAEYVNTLLEENERLIHRIRELEAPAPSVAPEPVVSTPVVASSTRTDEEEGKFIARLLATRGGVEIWDG